MEKIAEIWGRVQRNLFPYLREELGPLTEGHERVVLVLEVVRVEAHVRPGWMRRYGRRPKDRKALARAFVAKMCYNEATTSSFLDRLRADRKLRQICGWQLESEIPSESTFSRAFEEFAKMELADRVHEALVKKHVAEDVVWHVSRDSTAIEAREKPVEKEVRERPKRKRGRPKKGEERPAAEPTRLERQYVQTSEGAIAELPKACDVGTKIDSRGSKRHWVGYKFHVDVGDGGIPLSAITTSASVHDSQVAIPLAKKTAGRVASWYDLMDSAYDADLIHRVSRELGHVPIIEPHQGRRKGTVWVAPDRARRYEVRTMSERFNARLKDDCGGRNVRVRGHSKVHAHLMFGLLVVFSEALLGLVT